MSGKKSHPNKRDRSVFDAVSFLDSQDTHAEKRKRQQTKFDDQRRTAAASQTKIFGSLMECRILLQRAMQHSETTSGKAVEKCTALLVKLLEARQSLAATARPAKIQENGNDNMVDYESVVVANDATILRGQLQQEYEDCRDGWKEVLNRRHKDVRLHAGLTAKAQFRVVDSSFWEQVDATVQHEELRENISQRNGDEVDVKSKTFDDTKVYQHLLQDFVLSANQTGATLARDRLKQVSSQSQKKSVDRRASKGRKIRYHEIPKLMNYTFPVTRPQSQSVLDEGEWFSSLFGGTGMYSR